MNQKLYTSEKALEELRAETTLEDFQREVYERKPYYQVLWPGESAFVDTAIGATMYEDFSSQVPFGVQNELLRQKIVEEVLLICQKWDYVYRIPAADFFDFPMTREGDRRLFTVYRLGQISSEDTPRLVSITKYQRQRQLG